VLVDRSVVEGYAQAGRATIAAMHAGGGAAAAAVASFLAAVLTEI
jgi:hypothetical protein